MTHSKPLHVFDLFSGVGGFSLALKGAMKTVAFCEIDPDCRKVLKKKFGNAPIIFNNIKDVNIETVLEHTILSTVEVMTGGFPCTDISIANLKGKGLEGEFSGLFSEIVRLIDLLPDIKCVYLENSPNIKNRGLDSVLTQLGERGFTCNYTFINASDVGALHKRKRWYCLCYKADTDILQRLKCVSHKRTVENIDWKGIDPSKRILCKQDHDQDTIAKSVKRCRMMGNSIVPQCAAYAWNCLVKATRSREHTANREIKIPNLIENEIKIDCTDGTTTFTKNRWATPNYSFWHMFSGITSSRHTTTFVVQIYYDKQTLIKEFIPNMSDEKHGALKRIVFNKYICNPVFIEHMMGYPQGWTEI